MDDIVTQLRQHINHPAMRARTHWDGCIDSHPTCALVWALDEIERLQAELADWQRTVRACEEEISRLRTRTDSLSRENDFLQCREASRAE